jgi:ABC-type uncharacterized transport system involved in gliding motility auxiliary subunit
MRKSYAVSGIIGLVFLLFAAIDYVTASSFPFFVLVNLIAGVFAIVLWVTSNRGSLATVVGSRTARHGTNAVIYTVAFVGVLVAINYLSTLHHARFDLSAEKIYSLSPQSVSVAKELKQPLKFYGFFTGGTNPAARSLYEEYTYASPLISYELVDPDRHPELAQRFKVSVLNTTHIQYAGDKGNGTNVTDLNEQALTNAIIRVSQSGEKIAYYLVGHGEPNLDELQNGAGFGQFRQALEGEGYQVKTLLLASQPAVPKDCQVLVVAGPAKPLFPHEVEQIGAYLKKGGRVLVMLRPPYPSPTDEAALVKLVDEWGISAGDNIVVDQVVRLFAGPALGLNPVVDTYGPHPITTSFDQRTVFPMARAVEAKKGLKQGLDATWLAKTSETSWAEHDLAGIFQRQTAKFSDGDVKGPITVANAVDADLGRLGWGSGHARLVIFGSTDLADNEHINDFFNRDLLMNSTDWLLGQANAISIRPRALRLSRINLTVSQFNAVFVLSVLLLPELLLVAGIVVWWQRRN